MKEALGEKIITKEDYYKDSEFCSFSALKVFSKCETLYRDIFIDRTYEEPDHDYFTYGKLVDALVTEPESFIGENFVRVERRIDPEDALKFENEIIRLEDEVRTKTQQIQEKLMEKELKIVKKIDELKRKLENEKITDEVYEQKLSEFNSEIMDLENQKDKTLLKGIESRKILIEQIKTSLGQIKELAGKIQVTGALWENAEQTALAIKTHPSFVEMEFNEYTSQQIFTATMMQFIPCKGKLDHLKLSPAIAKVYAIYVAKQMTLAELQDYIKTKIHPQDMWAIITDIKTCKDLATLEPYNTHYRGQLGFYRQLVAATLCLPLASIRCRILVADKMSNNYKKCELFQYTENALGELENDVWLWAKMWKHSMDSKLFTSAKEKNGMKQRCFTCRECRFCPFSMRPGDPVIVDAPRFGNDEIRPLVEAGELSTADAVLDY